MKPAQWLVDPMVCFPNLHSRPRPSTSSRRWWIWRGCSVHCVRRMRLTLRPCGFRATPCRCLIFCSWGIRRAWKVSHCLLGGWCVSNRGQGVAGIGSRCSAALSFVWHLRPSAGVCRAGPECTRRAGLTWLVPGVEWICKFWSIYFDLLVWLDFIHQKTYLNSIIFYLLIVFLNLFKLSIVYCLS